MAADDPFGVKRLIVDQMTLAEFARAMLSTPQTVNHWIARGLPGQRLFRAAEVLGKTVDDLREYTAEGRKPPANVEREVRAFSRLFETLSADVQKDVLLRLQKKQKPV